MVDPIPQSNILRQQLARQQNPGGAIPTPDVQGLRTSSPGAPEIDGVPTMPSVMDLQVPTSQPLPDVPDLPEVPLPEPTDPFAHIAPVNSPYTPVLGHEVLYDGPTYTDVRSQHYGSVQVPLLSPRQSLTDLALNIPNDVWNDTFNGTRRAFGRSLLEGLGSIFNWEAQAGKTPIGTLGPVLGAVDFYAEQMGFQAPFGNQYGWNFGEMGAGPLGALFYHLGILQNTAQGIGADIGRAIGAFTYGISGSVSGNVGLSDFFNIGSQEYQGRVREFYQLTEDGEYLPYTIRALRGDRLGFTNFTYNENNRFQPYAFLGDAEDFTLWQRSDRDSEIIRRRQAGEPASPETLPAPPSGQEQLRMQARNAATYGHVFTAVALDVLTDPFGPFNNLARSIASRQSRAIAPAANQWRPGSPSPVPDNFPSYTTPRIAGGSGASPGVPPRPVTPPSPPSIRRVRVDVLPDPVPPRLTGSHGRAAPALPPGRLPPDVPAGSPGLYNDAARYQRHFVPDMPDGITVETPSVPGFDVSQASIPQPRNITPQHTPAFAPQIQFADAARYAAGSRVARFFDLRRVNLAVRSPDAISDLASSYGVPSTPRTTQYLLPSVEDAALRRHLQHTATNIGTDIPPVPPAQYVVPLDAPTLRAMTGRVPMTFTTKLSEGIAELSRDMVPTQDMFQVPQLVNEAIDLAVSRGEIPPQIERVITSQNLPADIVPVNTAGMSGATFFANDTSFFKVYPQFETGDDTPMRMTEQIIPRIVEAQSMLGDAAYIPPIISHSPYHVEFSRIDGVNLSTYLIDNPDIDVTPITNQLLDIFADMEARDLVVMDISLDNMMVDTSGKLWMLDLDSIDEAQFWRDAGQPHIMPEMVERSLRAVLLQQPENRAAALMRHAIEELMNPSISGVTAAYDEYRHTLPHELTVPDEPDYNIIEATRDYVQADNRLEEAASKLSEMEAQLHEVTNVQNRTPSEGYFAQGLGSGARLYRNADGSVTKHIPLERWSQADGALKVAQLHEEFDMMEKLQHLDFVPRVYEKTDTGYIMEFIEGTVLNEFYGNNVPLLAVPESVARRIATELPAALKQMADVGVLYYDLHGGNIIVKPDGTWKLIDFGDAAPVSTAFDHELENRETLESFTKTLELAIENLDAAFEIKALPNMYEHRPVKFETYDEFLEAWGGEDGVRNALKYPAGRRTFLNSLGDLSLVEAQRLQSMQYDDSIGDEVLDTMQRLLGTEFENIDTPMAALSEVSSPSNVELDDAHRRSIDEWIAELEEEDFDLPEFTASAEPQPVDFAPVQDALQEAGLTVDGDNIILGRQGARAEGVITIVPASNLAEVSFTVEGSHVREGALNTREFMHYWREGMQDFNVAAPILKEAGYTLYATPAAETPEELFMKTRAYSRNGFVPYISTYTHYAPLSIDDMRKYGPRAFMDLDVRMFDGTPEAVEEFMGGRERLGSTDEFMSAIQKSVEEYPSVEANVSALRVMSEQEYQNTIATLQEGDVFEVPPITRVYEELDEATAGASETNRNVLVHYHLADVRQMRMLDGAMVVPQQRLVVTGINEGSTLTNVLVEAVPETSSPPPGPVFSSERTGGQLVDIGQGRMISMPEGMTKAIADAVPLDSYDEVARYFGGQPVPIQEFMARGEVMFMEAYMRTLAKKKFPGLDIHVVTETVRETAYAYYTLLQGLDELPDGVTSLYIGRGHDSIIDGTWSTSRDGVTYRWQEIVDNELDGGERALILSGSDERALIPELARDMWIVLQAGAEKPVLVGSGNFYPAQAGSGAEALMDAFRRYNSNPMDPVNSGDLVEQIKYELEEITKEMYRDAIDAMAEFERAERALATRVENAKKATRQFEEEAQRMRYRQRDIELGSGNRDHCL
jgi:RIO-like serine/threonine protein kinase